MNKVSSLPRFSIKGVIPQLSLFMNKYPPVKQAVLVTPYKGSLLTAPKGAFLIDRQPYLFFNLV
ncbi:hypothetical protein, partial [Lysinibacillus halotolerans]|uniref:hypothetical protein n=1 Tax=Lysinibacillus halotolerans TaxID=1368476 RepID=UPI0019D4AEA0